MRPAVLWFAVLGGPAAWVLHLGLSYAAVPFVCATAGELVLHVFTGAAALMAGAAAWAGWRGLERVGGWAGGEPRAHLSRFVAAAGLLLSGFFLLLILVEGLPVLIQRDPCLGIPLQDQPIVGEPPAGEVRAAEGPSQGLREAVAARSEPPAGEVRAAEGPLQGLPEAVAAAGVAPRGWSGGAQASPANPPPPSLRPPPVGPEGARHAWNADPVILLVLGIATAWYLTGLARLWRRAGKGRGVERWRALCYLAGIWVLFLALVSPVHAGGEALFSVHMVQHLLLMVGAAPLLVLGRPDRTAVWALPVKARGVLARRWSRAGPARTGWRALTHPLSIFTVHLAVLWAWHIPALYEAALAHPLVHHLEHVTFFGAAVLFWWALARVPGPGRLPGHGAGILYVFATALHSGALGALILFAPQPWYPGHAGGWAAWGVDPLTDQQVAGALMWVPAGLAYAAAAVALLLAWMKRAERAAARRDRTGWHAIRAAPGAAARPADQPKGGTA